MRISSAGLAGLLVLGMSGTAPAYIDGGGAQVTLTEIVSEFRTVTLLELEKADLARGGFKFKVGRPLKGEADAAVVKLQVTDAPFKDLAPGRVAVHFTQSCAKRLLKPSSPAFENLLAQRACLTFLDGAWFYTAPGVEGWQSGAVRPDFERVFTGTSAELADAVAKLLRGHDVVVRCRSAGNAAETRWVRYSLGAPNEKALARDPSAPPARQRPAAAWVRDLRDPEAGVRAQAALALAELGPDAREADVPLTQALKDPDPEVRYAAVAALGAAVPESAGAVEGLARALSDENWFVRFTAARVLRNFGPRAKPAVPALVRALSPNDAVKDFRPLRCGMAMVALARIDPAAKELEGAFALIVGKLLEDERQGSFGARATGARLLGDCGPSALSTVPALVRRLEDPEGDVRVSAAEALLKIAPERRREAATAVLVAELKNPDLLIRLRAAEALGSRGPEMKRSLPALQALLQDPEPEVRRAAEQALRSVAGN